MRPIPKFVIRLASSSRDEDKIIPALLHLHLLIALRFGKKYHREIAGLIVVVTVMDSLSAGGLNLRSLPGVLMMVGLFVMVQLQVLRKDASILGRLLLNPRRFILLENFLIGLPLLLLLVVFRQWILCGVFVTISIAGAFIPKQLRLKRLKIPVYLPARAFEWIGGVRQYWLLLLLLYVAVVVFNSLAVIALLAMIALPYLLTGFFVASESHLMLTGFAESQSFFRKKFALVALMYLLFSIPLIVVGSVRIHSHWYLIPSLFILGLLFIWSVVLSKYANYEQGNIPKSASSVRNLVIAMTMLLPLITIGYDAWLFRAARKRLPLFHKQ